MDNEIIQLPLPFDVPMRACSKCGKPCARRKKTAKCPACYLEACRAYYRANAKKVIARTTRYRREHPDMQRRAKQAWQARNPERYQTANRQYAQRWRERNRERDRQNAHQWAKNNPHKYRYIQHQSRARRRNAPGTYTLEEWEQLKARFEYRCLCCGKQEPEIVLTVDHVIPFVLGGRNDIANIQPLCRSCNSAKSDRHTTDYR